MEFFEASINFINQTMHRCCPKYPFVLFLCGVFPIHLLPLVSLQLYIIDEAQKGNQKFIMDKNLLGNKFVFMLNNIVELNLNTLF
jgi:hypothetical protein